jgi:hypothetical protein
MMAGKIKTPEDCRFPALSSAILNAIGQNCWIRLMLPRANASNVSSIRISVSISRLSKI